MTGLWQTIFGRRKGATGIPVARTSDLLVTPCAQHLMRYWLAKGGVSHLPSRSDIDPAGLTAVLPHLFMFDVRWDPLCFLFRLVGTKVVDLFGRDLTGCRVDAENLRDVAFWHYDLMKPVATDKTPRAFHAKAAWENVESPWLGIELLYLPLSSDGTMVDVLIGTAAYHGANHVTFNRHGDPTLFDISMLEEPMKV